MFKNNTFFSKTCEKFQEVINLPQHACAISMQHNGHCIFFNNHQEKSYLNDSDGLRINVEKIQLSGCVLLMTISRNYFVNLSNLFDVCMPYLFFAKYELNRFFFFKSHGL